MFEVARNGFLRVEPVLPAKDSRVSKLIIAYSERGWLGVLGL